jgi:hypothetical protein
LSPGHGRAQSPRTPKWYDRTDVITLDEVERIVI